MHPAIRQNNVLASNLYFASCLFALIRVSITLYNQMILRWADTVITLVVIAIVLSLYMGIQYLFGIGLRKGLMWVKILFLTVTILGALVYLASLFGAIPTGLAKNYDTPFKAFLLATEFFLSLWAVVVIFQGFGIIDRVSVEALSQPVAGEAPDTGIAASGHNRVN